MTFPLTASSDLPRPRGRWKTILLIAVIFICGLAIGAGGATLFIVHQVRYAIHHPDEMPAKLTSRLTHQLSLNAEQANAVKSLLTQRMKRLNALRLQFQQPIRAQLQRLHADIRKVLNPQQQTKWDTLYNDLIDNWPPEPVQSEVPATESSVP